MSADAVRYQPAWTPPAEERVDHDDDPDTHRRETAASTSGHGRFKEDDGEPPCRADELESAWPHSLGRCSDTSPLMLLADWRGARTAARN
ncbi:hypothetical protein ABZX95_46850 [Streptomyces sp. NPDC004232]|uniref:hypothetical protein n=1 Tax=Streptomyces sp. NPDC004232 TaxID=3154454 RepID=UPI0033B2F038